MTDAEKEIIKSNSIISANNNSLFEKKDLLSSEKEIITKIKKKFDFQVISVNEIEIKKEEIKNEGVNLRENLKLLQNFQELNSTKNNLDLLFEKIKIVFQTELKIIDFKDKYADFINKNTSSEKIFQKLKELSDKYETEQENQTKIVNSKNENEKILLIKNL